MSVDDEGGLPLGGGGFLSAQDIADLVDEEQGGADFGATMGQPGSRGAGL